MKSDVASRIVAFGVVMAICYFAAVVIEVLLLAILLTILLDPAVAFLQRLRIPQALAALFMLLVVVGICYLGALMLYGRVAQFAEALPSQYRIIRSTVLDLQRKSERLQNQTEQVIPPSEEEPKRVVVVEHPLMERFIPSSFAGSYNVAFLIGFLPFLTFYMLNWKQHTYEAFLDALSYGHRDEMARHLSCITTVIRRFLFGNLVLGLILSGLSAGLFLALRLDNWIVLGLVSGFSTLIPYLGAILAMTAPLLAAMDQLHSVTPYLVLIGGVLAIHIIGMNLILPKLVGAMVHINPLALTLGLLIWGWMWGALGLVLVVPLLASAKAIFENIPSLRHYARLIDHSSA